MKRSILKHLFAWKSRESRKPLVMLGARQVGKTHVMREFGLKAYQKIHEFNFQAQPSLRAIFEKDLDPRRVLRDLELFSETTILNNGEHLIFFDEIQECPKALTSLKYFCENAPNLHLAAAGSLLGLHLTTQSFPVGKVDFLYMHPMSFSEVLEASVSTRDLDHYQESLMDPKRLSHIAHERYWRLFKCYLVTGGLPESVATWISYGGFDGGLQAFQAAREKLAVNITGYVADIARQSGKINSMHIERTWRNVPQQLAQSQDTSTSRFKFKDVLPGLASYRDLSGPINWLIRSGLLIKVPICQSAQLPLSAYVKENIFKLYMFDVGILTTMLDLKPKTIMDFDFGTYKGYLAENFVLEELQASQTIPSYSSTFYAWQEGQAEIEFLLQDNSEVIPLEVKAGTKVRAKSLRSFMDRYQPKHSIILSGRMPDIVEKDGTNQMNLPLYFASSALRISVFRNNTDQI